MVKYRPVLQKLREQHASEEAGDSIPVWLDTLSNSPKNSIPPASPPRSSASSPPATPPHLRMRRGRLYRKPLQTSQGNQGPPRASLKRKMKNHDTEEKLPRELRDRATLKRKMKNHDTEEKLPRELRDRATLKMPARLRDGQEQVLHSHNVPVRGSESPQKQQARGRRRGATSGQGHPIGSGQITAGPRLVLNDISPGNPATPVKGQERSSSSSVKPPQSPDKSSDAPDRTVCMARMVPGVLCLSPSECLYDRKVMPSARTFWLDYIRSNTNVKFIPSYFHEEIFRQEMTPQKTKTHTSKGVFTDPKDGWYGNFHEKELDFLFKEVCDVIEMATRYRNTDCTEAHWMAVVVHPLLRVFRRLAKYEDVDGFQKLEVVDMTSVDLNTYHAPKDPTNDSKPLDKQIDAALGLSLTSVQRDFLIGARYNDAVRSINPIDGIFGAFNPFFAHIKIKLRGADITGTHLGTWAAAEFSKRELEGYSLDMPIASISIVGDEWNLWVAYPEGFGENVREGVAYGPCVLMGPVSIGNTMGVQGVFEILQYLCQCADWGLSEYRGWFEKEILRRYGWVPEGEKVKGNGKQKA